MCVYRVGARNSSFQYAFATSRRRLVVANKTKNMSKTSDQSPPQPLALVSVWYGCRSFSDFAAYAQSLDLGFYISHCASKRRSA